MLPTAKIIVDNLEALLRKHQIKPAHFADMAESKGLEINRSFISRLMSGASMNITIQKLDALVAAAALLEPGVTAADLLTPGMLSESKKALSFDELSGIINQLLFELTDLNWLEIGNDVPKKMVSDYIGINLRKHIPDAIQESRPPSVAEN